MLIGDCDRTCRRFASSGSQAELSMVGIQWIDGVVVTVAVAQVHPQQGPS